MHGFLLVFDNNFLPKTHSFWDIWLQIMSRYWNPDQRSLEVIWKVVPFDRLGTVSVTIRRHASLVNYFCVRVSCWITYFYAALLARRGPHIASHSVCPSVCPSVCLSVRPVIITERHVAPPSELQWHTCTFRHAQRAAYCTAISAAQTCLISF